MIEFYAFLRHMNIKRLNRREALMKRQQHPYGTHTMAATTIVNVAHLKITKRWEICDANNGERPICCKLHHLPEYDWTVGLEANYPKTGAPLTLTLRWSQQFSVLIYYTEKQKAEMRLSYLPVHLEVQRAPVGPAYQGSPLIETKKGVNSPPGYNIKQTCKAINCCFHTHLGWWGFESRSCDTLYLFIHTG